MKQLRFAVVGDNIGYSLSPQIFEAIFRVLGIQGKCEVHSVSREQLGECLRNLVNKGVTGFSVTIPHKQRVIEVLDEIDPVAQAVSAVNSVKVDAGRLYGYNTDCLGFTTPLRPHASQLADETALILGTGGVSRAVVYSLWKDFSVTQIVLAGRTIKKADLLKQDLEISMPGLEVTPATLGGDLAKHLSSTGIVVNCTPLGGPNHLNESPFAHDYDIGTIPIYYDLSYNKDNALLLAASEAGAITLDGSAMLVVHAIRSLEIWSGLSVDYQSIYDAVFPPCREVRDGCHGRPENS